jgi:cytochrome P450
MMLVIHISSSGNGPTACLLGNGLMALARHPGQYETLRTDLGFAARAVEETLRYDSPTHMVGRFAVAEVEVGGRKVRPGETAYVVIGAANRDPAQFDDPDQFDLEREEMRHLSFGQGIHFCLGAPVARLIASTVFSTVARRFARIEVANEGFERGGTMMLRGPRALPLLFG